MNKKQIRSKVNEMIRTQNEQIRKHIEHLLKSGAIDYLEYEDNYRLPKILMSVTDAHMSKQWEPLDKADKATAKNLNYY
jgi:hypothetical protein